jgi:hypothetical protein
MKIKRILIILLVFALLAGFASCGVRTTPPSQHTVNELAEVIINSIEFPALWEHTEQADIELFTSADFADIEEIACFQQAVTVHLAEVLVIKPKESRMDAVMDFLRRRQAKLKDELAFYPAQLSAAEAMVVGNSHGFAYLICHDDAQEAEKVLLEFIQPGR